MYDDSRNDIEKIKCFVDSAKEEIQNWIKIKDSFQIENNLEFQMQIDLVVEDLFAKLSKPLYAFSQTTCERFIIRLNENDFEFKENLISLFCL